MSHHTLETATLLAMDTIMDTAPANKMLYALMLHKKSNDSFCLSDDPTESLQDVLENAEFMDGKSGYEAFCIIRVNRKTGTISTLYNQQDLRSILNDREEVRANLTA